MYDITRSSIYDYVYNMFYDVVTKNVYKVDEPQELTEDDTKNGFIIIKVGDMNDQSEFFAEAYGTVRVFITAYIPTRSRGRLDRQLYKEMEKAILDVILDYAQNHKSKYYNVLPETLISMDNFDSTNKDNAYHQFIKSFQLMIGGINDDEITPKKYTLYIGRGGMSITSIDELNDLGEYRRDDINGDYAVNLSGVGYVWVCVEREISHVKSSGYEVPMEEPLILNGVYCYRTSNALLPHEMKFTLQV